MSYNKIVFVTHNIEKIKLAEKYFKDLKFTTFNYELDEPRRFHSGTLLGNKIFFKIH